MHACTALLARLLRPAARFAWARSLLGTFLLGAVTACAAPAPQPDRIDTVLREGRPAWLQKGMSINELMRRVVQEPRVRLERVSTEGPYARFVYRVKNGPMRRRIVSAQPASFFTAVVRDGKVVGVEDS